VAIAASRVTVGTSATLVAANTSDARLGDVTTWSFIIEPESTTEPLLYAGGSGVTTGNGFGVKSGRWPFVVDLEPGEELYMVGASSAVVHVLQGGRS
jgi:hypothetical protein